MFFSALYIKIVFGLKPTFSNVFLMLVEWDFIFLLRLPTLFEICILSKIDTGKTILQLCIYIQVDTNTIENKGR